MDSIATGEAQFDSSRLVYTTPASHLNVEFLRIGDGIHGTIALDRFSFTPLKNDPRSTDLVLAINGENFNYTIPLRKGGMKAALTPEITAKIILALQEGKEVAILVAGASQILTPQSFDEKYRKFSKKQTIFSNLFKGPLE